MNFSDFILGKTARFSRLFLNKAVKASLVLIMAVGLLVPQSFSYAAAIPTVVVEETSGGNYVVKVVVPRGGKVPEFKVQVNNVVRTVNPDEVETTTITKVENIKDVPSSYWAENAIKWAVELGYMGTDADGYFRPNNTVSKREAAKILFRAFGPETPTKRNFISDLERDDSGKDEVEWLNYVTRGFDFATVNGRRNFYPNDKITRKAFVTDIYLVALANRVEFKGKKVAQNFQDVLKPSYSYNDGSARSYSLDAMTYKSVLALSKEGLITGTRINNKLWFLGDAAITRAELASLLLGVMNIASSQGVEVREQQVPYSIYHR